MLFTDLYLSEVYSSVSLPMAVPTTKPASSAQKGFKEPIINQLSNKPPTITKPVAIYSPKFKARWGSEFSLPRTKKAAITEPKMPMAQSSRGNMAPVMASEPV